MRVSAGSMLARIRRLEHGSVSPMLKILGSIEEWERGVTASIEGGRMCSHDGPIIFQCVRNWINEPYQSHEGTLATRRFDPPRAADPVVEATAPEAAPLPVINTQAEHERLYQDFKRSLPEGARQYLKHKQQQVMEATRPRNDSPPS